MVKVGDSLVNMDVVPLKNVRRWKRHNDQHWFRQRLWFIKMLNDGYSGGVKSFLEQNPHWPKRNIN